MKRLLTLLLCALLCTGCTALPAEERAFAVVLGIDRPDDAWQVHARVPTYQTGGGYTTVTGDGDTLAAALAALDASAPMHLHLGQLRMLIFSENLAQTDSFSSALNELSVRHDLRLQATAAITNTDMKALFDALKPSVGARLSKSIDVLLETRIGQGTLLPAALADVIRMGERQSPVLPAITLDGQDVKISGAYPISQTGTAGEQLTPDDMQLLSLMSGASFSGTLSLPEGTVTLMSAASDVELSTPTMYEASVRLTLRYTASNLTEPALSRAVASACLGVMNRLAAANCDALGLARQAITHTESMADWHALDWKNRYPEIVWSVSVGVQPAA